MAEEMIKTSEQMAKRDGPLALGEVHGAGEPQQPIERQEKHMSDVSKCKQVLADCLTALTNAEKELPANSSTAAGVRSAIFTCINELKQPDFFNER